MVNPEQGRQAPRIEQIRRLREDMAEAGEGPPEVPHSGINSDASGAFKEWLKRKCEGELWFLARWLLENDYLALGDYHRKVVCPFGTDFSTSRSKLFLLAMGHLKTTLFSRSMPIHVLIQPAEHNRYFPGKAGCETRILLANEAEEKSKENLAVIKTHLESNDWLYWLWPEIIWSNPKAEAPRWSDRFIQVRRRGAWAEPSVTAIGIKTGFVGRYYDLMIPDDIAALEASQSRAVLERAKKFRRALKTRRVDKEKSIIIGVGTEWPACDLYAEWEKDPTVQVMINGIVDDNDVPYWPEKYPPAMIETMRKECDAVEWAAWYMNKRVGRGVTALDWHLLRGYEVSEDGLELTFVEADEDRLIVMRRDRISTNLGFNLSLGKYHPDQAAGRRKPPPGMEKDAFDHYHEKYIDAAGRNLIHRRILGA